MGKETVDSATDDLKGLGLLGQKLWNYLTSEELWNFILVATIKITVILVVSWLVVFVGKKVIANVFALRMRAPLSYSERRQKTILKLLQSVLSYLVYFSAIMGILSALNIQIAGLLAGAGIAGLAIGFGAQSLVKDVITGFFIIFEDQFGVGDYIKLNGAEGTVYEIGLRTTKIKGSSGEQHIIPNGAIGTVINYSINDTSTFVDFIVPATVNIDEVEEIVEKYLKPLAEEYEELTRSPILLGVQSFTTTDVTLRIKVETTSMQHSKMARIIRRDLMILLEKHGITMG